MVCDKLKWRSPNGYLKVIPCLEALRRMKKEKILSLLLPQKHGGYHEIKPVSAEQVNFIPEKITEKIRKEEKLVFKLAESNNEMLLWRYLIQRYHYLGYRRLVGRHIKYFVYCQDKLVAVLNNNRFLILPWVNIKNLGSRILGQSAKIVPVDWEKRYGCRPKFMETFIEAERFSGTVYKAAN